jgi:hypothetical protein
MSDDEAPDLLKHAQKITAKNVAELEGPEDDIMPTFLWLGPHGMGLMPLVPMTDWRQKDRLAAGMMAALCVSQATEAVFVSTSWMVKSDRPPDMTAGKTDADSLLGGLMPSEHPDRVEVIVAIYQGKGDRSYFASAEVIRYPDKPPDLREWDTKMSDAKVGGRFAEAIMNGLSMVESMPQEMVDIIESGWREGEQQDLMRRFLKVYGDMTGVRMGVDVLPVMNMPEGSTITAQQMSMRYDIPLRTIYEVCRSGYLPARREKGRWVIDEMEAADYAFGYALRKKEMEDK